MGAILLDNISFEPDRTLAQRRLRVDPESALAVELDGRLAEATEIARPKALYHVGLIESRDDDGVVIDGIRFTSRVLAVNLAETHRVFAYVATCGSEIDAWAHAMDDVLHQYWAETIKEMALRAAMAALSKDIAERLQPSKLSTMNPGSLRDWPLKEQRQLFALFGEDTEDTIGVRLEKSLLMSPNKSVSGIRFETEHDFASCQLCPRRDCPGRRAPYDADLYDRRYKLDSPSGDAT